eukprot:147092-Ditylum_brightwellii.AAC.1
MAMESQGQELLESIVRPCAYLHHCKLYKLPPGQTVMRQYTVWEVLEKLELMIEGKDEDCKKTFKQHPC